MPGLNNHYIKNNHISVLSLHFMAFALDDIIYMFMMFMLRLALYCVSMEVYCFVIAKGYKLHLVINMA